MRAITIERFATPGAVREMPEPTLDERTVVIRVTVAGVNPVDWKTRDGKSGDRPMPMVLGQDFAGIVERVGTAVTRVAPGDRVFGCARAHGSYAERTWITDGQHDSPFATIPSGVTDAQAAALPTPGLTALASLNVLQVEAGTRVAIIGAAGAVGAAAVQIAYARGARVVAVVKPGQAAAVRALGADLVIEADHDVAAVVHAAVPDAFPAVLDVVSSGAALEANVSLVAPGGRLVSTIHVADEAWFAQHGISATNVKMYETPESSPAGLTELATMVADGRLHITIAEERPLDEAPAVLDQIKAGKLTGKITLRV